MFSAIQQYLQSLEKEFSEIPEKRKQQLHRLSSYIQNKQENGDTVNIIVICTHNSRRSHLGQIWLAVAADYLGIKNISTFSGGTEATAFNPRAVSALKRVGFKIKSRNAQIPNPIYEIQWRENQKAYSAFSKKYDELPNPQEKFAAIMVCAEADKACPVVPCTDLRLALPFDDPKAYDDTELEREKYDERCRDIGREMLFVLKV